MACKDYICKDCDFLWQANSAYKCPQCGGTHLRAWYDEEFILKERSEEDDREI